MYISISTGAELSRLGIDGGMKAISEAGFEAMDFGLDGFLTWRDATRPETTEIPFFSDDGEIARYTEEIKATAKKYGLRFGQFHAPFPTYNPRNPLCGENMKMACRKSIEITAACGCDTIVIHPCFAWEIDRPLDPEEEWKVNIDFYSSFIPTLKKCGVKCCLENMFITDGKSGKSYAAVCSCIPTACRYIDTLNEIAGEKLFGFCLDTGHLQIVGGDLEFAVRELGDRLIALHVHDNDGMHDDHNTPYAGGITRWERFFKGLREVGYQGNMNFETGGVVNRYPEKLIPSILRLLADTAAYFREEVQKPKA